MSTSLTTNSNKFLQPHKAAGDKRAISVMDRLFNRLDGIYPHKWRSAFASEQAIENWRDAWADAFLEERLTLHEIKTGLNECRRAFDWPPSLPEFLRLCRPNLAPDLAWHEAVTQMGRRAEGRDVWSHPAIYWTAVGIGEFDLKNLTFTAIKPRWERLLAENIKKDLKPVPKRLDALPPPGRTQANSAEGLAKLRAMCEELATNKAIDLPSDMHKCINGGLNE
jgi:hypothetical protein